MNILVTGANGFVGRNLLENLKNIRDGKDRTRPAVHIGELYAYTRASTPQELDEYCARADFVFHFAGVNRPKDAGEFHTGNVELTKALLDALRRHGSTAPVVLSSSVQATLAGRYDGDYGRSKRAGEELVFRHAEETGAKALVYRFPNLAGKWCRPNYNSAVATFCHNIANDLPITVNDPSVELELLFIDDLVTEMLDALEGREHRAADGRFCAAPVTHRATLGHITELLYTFRDQPHSLVMPSIAPNSLEKKLYSMYLSYLPREKAVVPLKMNTDERGSFTEVLKTLDHGQFSVNISKPGVTKGRHWHNVKWELFIVVSGRGLIRQRRLGTDEGMEFEVSGERLQAVHMLPGYTHEITNIDDTDDLVTLMWANECFDPAHPDTFFEPV